MKFFFSKIKNRSRLIFFLLFNYFNKNYWQKKLSKILKKKDIKNKVELLYKLYFDNKSNPLILFWYCYYSQFAKNFIKAFNIIKHYDSLLLSWLKKNNLYFTSQLTFLNSAHISGAFGNQIGRAHV